MQLENAEEVKIVLRSVTFLLFQQADNCVPGCVRCRVFVAYSALLSEDCRHRARSFVKGHRPVRHGNTNNACAVNEHRDEGCPHYGTTAPSNGSIQRPDCSCAAKACQSAQLWPREDGATAAEKHTDCLRCRSGGPYSTGDRNTGAMQPQLNCCLRRCLCRSRKILHRVQQHRAHVACVTECRSATRAAERQQLRWTCHPAVLLLVCCCVCSVLQQTCANLCCHQLASGVLAV